jgi:hypothetical protein
MGIVLPWLPQRTDGRPPPFIVNPLREVYAIILVQDAATRGTLIEEVLEIRQRNVRD